MFGSSAPFGPPSGGFGQQNSTPAFGAPAAPFGGGGGGGSGFGTQPTFGSPAPSSGGFGGGFGSPAPAPAFGGGGTFGAPAPAPSAFGSSGGGFGSGIQSSSPFGAPAPAPSGGMFGSAPAPSGGLFGSSTSSAPGGFNTGNGGFGGGGGFGSTPAPAPTFGSTFGSPAPAASTGLFGAPAPSTFGSTNNAFGATSTGTTFGAPAPGGGMFGAPSPAPAGGMFGASSGGTSGTKLTPFAVTSKQDGSTTINLQSISAMAQYEQKSFEELRFEDYSQGNRGTGNAAAGSTGGFGGFGAASPAQSTGLFGTPAPASSTFGAPAPAPGGFSGFGGTPAPTSGFGATGAFGAPAPAFGTPAPATFGTPAPAPGNFGTTAFGAPPPSTGLFGTPAAAPAGSLFGSPAPASGGLFGSTPAAAPAFGAPAPATGGLFGTPAAAPTTGLFGAPAPAPFGAPAPGTFGGSATSGTFGGFGSPAPAPAGGLFNTPAPASFGAPTSGGLFGTPAPATGSIFGAPAASTFGISTPSSGIFGQPAPASTGVFGAPANAAAPQLVAAPPVGSIMPPATNEILTAQLTALENKRKEMEKSDNFRTRTNESSSVNASSRSESESLKSLTPLRTPFPSYHASPRSTSKIRPRGFGSPEKNTSLSALGTGGRPMAAPDSSAAASTTRLVIKPSPKPRIKLSLEPSFERNGSVLKIDNSAAQKSGTPSFSCGTSTSNGSANKGHVTISTEHIMANSSRNAERSDIHGNDSPREKSKSRLVQYKKVAPSLSKEGYVCTPTIDALECMSAEDLAAVQGFSVERPGVGKIEWEGAVDVRGLNLDTLVVIDDNPQSASVYTQEEKDGTKPPVGTKLNRPAIISLEHVFPPVGIPIEKFEKRVAKSTKRNNAELISYDPSSGKWKFRVLHFSRYALRDDDSDSEDETDNHFESGERGGRSPGSGDGGVGSDSNQAESLQHNTNESLSRGVLVTAENGDVTKSQLDLALLDTRIRLEDFESGRKRGICDSVMNGGGEMRAFYEESKVEDDWTMTTRCIPSTRTTNLARLARRGVCTSIALEANVKSSSIDFGFRMGRSFRAGWSPDGSFMAFGPLGTLSRRKPVFSVQSAQEENLLQHHRDNAKKVTGNGPLPDCPQFYLPLFKSDLAALKKALKSYKGMKVGDDENQLIVVAKMAFSLLGYLLENLDGRLENVTCKSRFSLEARRIHAITCWLVDSCTAEVDAEIDSYISQGKKVAALFAAVTGGDREKACNLAGDLGFFHLSTVLASRDASKNDMLRQALCWTDSATSPSLSEEFMRLCFLVGGDPKMEEDVYRKKYSPYDWRRRLAMLLVYGRLGQDPNLSAIIAAYEGKVQTGVAPFPQPRYLQGNNIKEIHCVLYRLLRLGGCGQMTSLIDTVCPLGYSASAHDYSLAFHLSSAISAMQYTPPLTPIEMASLIDSYTAQLLTSGKWEWAVYVSLCSFCPSDSNISSLARAKLLVLQNYTGATSECRRRRKFLELVGVSSRWFEEALALRCAICCDFHGHLCHMALVSDVDTLTTLEKVLIPKMFFMNAEELTTALKLLEVFAREEDSLAFAVYNFFQLSRSISALNGASQTEIESTVPFLFETCKCVEQVLQSYKPDGATTQVPLQFSPDAVPITSFLAEAMSQLSLFKLQLKALQSEIQISSSVSQILSLAQPKPHEISQLGISDRENICKWLL